MNNADLTWEHRSYVIKTIQTSKWTSSEMWKEVERKRACCRLPVRID